MTDDAAAPTSEGPDPQVPADLRTDWPTDWPTDWRRLDPKMLLVHPINETLQYLPAVLAAFVFGDYMGRKNTILIGTTIMSVGALLQCTAYSVPHMIVGRIVAGIGNGINTATAPTYQSETSQAAWRGKLIVIELIMNIAGFSLSNWVTFGFSYLPGGVSWRVPLALQFIFIVILYATVPWLPESPRWLVMKGRFDEAEQVLADLEGSEKEDPYIQTQLSEIKFAADYERDHAVRIRDLIRGKKGDQGGTCTTRRLLLGMGAQFMQQFSGLWLWNSTMVKAGRLTLLLQASTSPRIIFRQ